MDLLRERTPSRLVPLIVGLVALGIGIYVSVTLLNENDWNPSTFIKFPAASPEEIAYGNEWLGEVVPAERLGHDGKFFFKQAMDPFYLSPDQHAYLLDRPAYRAQRMVYPTLAGGFGLLPPQAIAWNLLILNLLALGVGTWLTAILAQELGISAWLGLAFVLNPGVLVSSFIDTAEVLAMLFLIAGSLFLVRKRYLPSAVFLTLAALSRESMILCAIGAAFFVWQEKRVIPKVFALPFIASALWWLYVRTRLGYLEGGLQDTKALGAPFKGFYEAMVVWLNSPGSGASMIMGMTLLAISLLVAWRAVRYRSILGYLTGGFTLIAVLMVEGVWLNYFDASRVLAPVITAYILMVASSTSRGQPDRIEPETLSA